MNAGFTTRWNLREALTISAAALLCLALASCGGGGGATSPPPPPTNNPIPTISSISPSSAVATGPAFTLTVNGTNFISSSVVHWNGSARTTAFVSSTKLTASIAAADIASVGTGQVTVFNPAPGGGTSTPAASFSITAAQAMSFNTSLLPASGAGKSYYFVMDASGGVPPLNWSLSSGALPSGLILDAVTDTVSSPPSTIGGRIHGMIIGSTANFTVQVADSAVPTHNVVTKPLSISVGVGPLPKNDAVCSATPGSDLATAISNGTIRASISPYKDIDVYSFTVSQTAQVTMEVFAQRLELDGEPSTTDSRLDSMMELLDSNCNTIAFNDDIAAGTVTDSKISASATPFPSPPCPPSGSTPCADITPPTSLAPGTYYIRIRDFRSDGRPDFIYDLKLSGAD